MNTNLTSHLNEDLAFSVNRSIELIAEATENNNHTLARLHATRPFMKTSGENFLKGHRWQSELADIDRCHRAMGSMTEALLRRRRAVTMDILNATSGILGQAIAEAMWAEM